MEIVKEEILQQQLLSTTRPWYWVYWVILVTYNIDIYICMHIYIVSYVNAFFIIFNCNVFSALHPKQFEIWKNILWNWWLDYVIAQSIKCCDISGCSLWIHFPFSGVFFSQENQVFFGLLVSCLSLSQSD